MLPLTETQRAALAAAVVDTDFGVDLLDANDNPVGDISPDVEALSVTHDYRADVHRSIDLTLTRNLQWGVDRVRPWITVNGYRWNLAVPLLTTPDTEARDTPRSRQVDGYDKLWLLQREVGDTYAIAAGTSYLDAIRAVLADAGVTGRLLLQGDRQNTLLEEPAVWMLREDGYTWLTIVNGLLGMIGYDHLWVDGEGRFRSAPFQAPQERGAVWHFDTTDPQTTLVGERRNLSADVFAQTNVWRFVRKKDRALTADDVYVVDRSAGAAFRRPKTVYVDAADPAALRAEGDRIVIEDTATERIVTFETTPLPFEHGDVVTVTDPDLGLTNVRCLVRSWTIHHDGRADVVLEVLGG